MIAADGYTYEKQAIEEWLSAQQTSPVTGKPIPKNLMPNYVQKEEMESKLLGDVGAQLNIDG